MSSVDVIQGREGALIYPAWGAYWLDVANARINAILAEKPEIS